MDIVITDAEGNVVATANVEEEGEYYKGSVNLDQMPSNILTKWEEYEDLVNDLVLSLLDEIEEKIQLDLWQVFLKDGTKLNMRICVIFPTVKVISLKKFSTFA